MLGITSRSYALRFLNLERWRIKNGTNASYGNCLVVAFRLRDNSK